MAPDEEGNRPRGHSRCSGVARGKGRVARRAGWELFPFSPPPAPGRPGRQRALPGPSPPDPLAQTLPPEGLLIAVAGLESPAKNVAQWLTGEEEAAGPVAGVGAERCPGCHVDQAGGPPPLPPPSPGPLSLFLLLVRLLLR